MRAALELLRHFKVQTAVWLAGRITQDQIGFFGSAVAFVDVAANASSDYIFPSIPAASRAGNHMVEG